MSFQCERVSLEARPALTRRWQTTMDALPKAFDETFSGLMAYMMELGKYPAGPPFAAYHRIDGQDVDVELGVPLSEALPGRDSIEASRMQGGEMATTLLVGPYDGLHEAYAALMGWIQEQGLEVAGAPFEQYLNNPAETTPDKYETRVYMPVRARE